MEKTKKPLKIFGFIFNNLPLEDKYTRAPSNFASIFLKKLVVDT